MASSERRNEISELKDGVFTNRVLEEAENYISHEVMIWLRGEETKDKKYMSKLLLRYSPLAIRCLLSSMRNNFIFPKNEQKGIAKTEVKRISQELYLANAVVYGLINGFYSHEDYISMDNGEGISDNLPVEYLDLIERSDNVFSSVKGVAKEVRKMKKEDPELKSVLFHGKWNGVPHAGHILFISRSLAKIIDEYGVNPDKLLVVVACEGNRYIQETRHPFLDTDWRMSLMSYLPIVDLVCYSGNFSAKQAGKAWNKNYKTLKPDFMPIQAIDVFAKKKIKQLAQHKIKPVLVGDWMYLDDDEKNRISMSGLLSGETSLEKFKNVNQYLLDQLGSGWQRDWFKKEV